MWRKYFPTRGVPFSPQRGFTVIELVLTMGIFVLLLSITSISLLGAKRQSSIDAAVNVFLADLRQQQVKAMVGDTEGRGTHDTYGIHFGTNSYTLFHGTYSSMDLSNFTVSFPDNVIFGTNTIPNNEIIFAQGSGEVSGFVSGSNTIVIRDPNSTLQKTITVNRFGVVIGIN